MDLLNDITRRQSHVTDINIHKITNGYTITVCTLTSVSEFAYKDLPTALRQVKHIVKQVDSTNEG